MFTTKLKYSKVPVAEEAIDVCHALEKYGFNGQKAEAENFFNRTNIG